MIKFKNIRNGEIKEAYTVLEEDDKIYIKFAIGGKEYGYSKNNIKILAGGMVDELPFIVFTYQKECYKCHKSTDVLTYILYDDNLKDVIYPYDFDRLLKNQNIFMHLEDPSIEYYGIKTIGSIEKYDKMIAERFPDRIKKFYSRTQNRSYPMNICVNCGSGQGENPIYRDINMIIKDKIEIKKFKNNL